MRSAESPQPKRAPPVGRSAERPSPVVRAKGLDGLLLEVYDYEPGPPADIERHVHESYQIGIALDAAGEYRYRGATEPVPTRSLVIVHPGEPHAVRDTGPRTERARYLMMYVDPARILPVGAATLPFFDTSPADPLLVQSFLDVFRSADDSFDAESSLVQLTGLLNERVAHSGLHAREREPPPPLVRVRDLLHDAPLADTPIAELARIADLHPQHLVRAFTAQFGLPPHRYRRVLRIDIAKRGLARGETLSKVALDTGFYDQSHFTRHFRRVVGTTPGRYLGAAARAR